MKKTMLFLFLITTGYFVQAQGFGVAASGGFLSELEGPGGTLDLIYELNEKWGIATNATFAVNEENSIRNKWFALDLNAQYKVIDDFYVLAGGEWLNTTLKGIALGGGNPLGGTGETSESFFGANIGAGYRYNFYENISVFAEVKYVAIETGYVHPRLGLHFQF